MTNMILKRSLAATHSSLIYRAFTLYLTLSQKTKRGGVQINPLEPTTFCKLYSGGR